VTVISDALDSLPAMDVGARAARLRPLFADEGIDALLVTNPRTSAPHRLHRQRGTVLVTADAMFTTDGRYHARRGARRRVSTPRSSSVPPSPA
jgi:hypothetical protein